MIEIYCDGSCSGNNPKSATPSPGGWCYVIITPCGCRSVVSGGEENSTNNRMELMAAVKAIERCYGDMTITTDSTYVVNAINQDWLGTWKKNNWTRSNGTVVSNVDLWQKMDELLSSDMRTVTFRWIKGHSSHPENDLCDKTARKISRDMWVKNKASPKE